MKVFMVHENPWDAGNPYIYTLIEGIRQLHQDCTFFWGREDFWSDEILSFDIVHFHWPQAFMGKDNHTENDLRLHIDKMKNAGVKVISTCHDLEPHYNQFADKAEIMNIVYLNCDAIIHLGEYSKALFEKQYPFARHFLLPHHLYDTVYTHFPSKEKSLDYLGLPKDKTYILCFGAFRAKQERRLILQLSKQLTDKNVLILAPSFMSIWWRSFRLLNRRIKKWYYRYRYNIICTGSTWKAVSDNDLPYYYGAADVVFIQRLKILNSGNSMMPMLFNKFVVGPDCGNVGPLLRRWGYFVFSVKDTRHIGSLISEAIKKNKSGECTVDKKKKQLDEYATSVVSEKLYRLYMNLISQ